jgi:FecR protein
MLGANFPTVRGRNPGVVSKLHVSRVVIASVLLFGGGEASWSQEKIGGAETVINSLQGNSPTGKQAPVAQGDNVFLGETLSTGRDSKANLVFNDNSNVTVGPDSTLKLEKFVYSGAKQPGTVSFSITNGTLRFINGDANKRAYTIWTPTAAIGARGGSLRLKATAAETQIINEEGTAIVCLRKGNENVSVEEMRRPCGGREEDQASFTGGKSRSCPCTALLLPSAQATITANEIAVAAAPLNAISEPFIGAPKDVRLLAADLPTHKEAPPPFLPPAPAAGGFGFDPWPLGAVAVGAGTIAVIAAFSSSNESTPFFFPVSPQ